MSQRSTFMGMPGEIRNTIYRFAVVEDRPIDVTSRTTPYEPAILASSGQIRSEAPSIYYAENTFIHRSLDSDREELEAWLKRLSPGRCKLISSLLIKQGLEPRRPVAAREVSIIIDAFLEDVISSNSWLHYVRMALRKQQQWLDCGLRVECLKFYEPDTMNSREDAYSWVSIYINDRAKQELILAASQREAMRERARRTLAYFTASLRAQQRRRGVAVAKE